MAALIVALAPRTSTAEPPATPAELPATRTTALAPATSTAPTSSAPAPQPATPSPTAPVAVLPSPAEAAANAAPGPGETAPASAAPTTQLTVGAEPLREDHKVAAVATLAGLYAGFTTWTYFAWYRKHKALADFKWGGDGWLGSRTYAGGADKFGHAWATMSLARLGTEMLDQWGGFDRFGAALVSTALSEALFIGVEVKDGFFYEFSFSDLTGDSVGALLALAFSTWPRLDELLDYRVQYWPSVEYRRQFSGGNVNIAEDYSGETYLLALHLGAIHALRDAKWGLWSQFVDVTLGYDTRGYKPDPPQGLPPYDHHQNMFIGVSLNAQGVFDWLLDGPAGRHPTARKVTHALFEVFNLPFTSLPVLEHTNTPTGAVANDGA